MSLAQGVPVYLSTAGNIGTRVKGPAVSGQIADGGAAGGPLPNPGGFICVQSTAALTNQVVTTSATGLQNASFVYVPLTTATLVGAAAPPFTGVGTPLLWNDADAILMVWSSSRSSWLNQTVTSSALLVDKKGFTSSV